MIKKIQPSSKKKPLISVIMPAYNAAPFITAAIESILQQTHKNIELIIIDDASNDGTSTIAKLYGEKNKRIRYYQNKQNLKEYKARNLGLSLARGQYIAWMDADDISHPTRLAKQLRFLQDNKNIDIVGSSCHFIDAKGKIIGRYGQWLSNEIKKEPSLNKRSITTMYHCCSSFFFRRSALNRIARPYFRALQIGTDTDLMFRLMARGAKISNLPEQLYYYRRHSSQVTHDNTLNFLSANLIFYHAHLLLHEGSDIIGQYIKKNGLIDKHNIFAVFPLFLQQPNLTYHPIFIKRWLQHFEINKLNLMMLKLLITYQPSLLIFTLLYSLTRQLIMKSKAISKRKISHLLLILQSLQHRIKKYPAMMLAMGANTMLTLPSLILSSALSSLQRLERKTKKVKKTIKKIIKKKLPELGKLYS